MDQKEPCCAKAKNCCENSKKAKKECRLPENAVHAGTSPVFNEKTIPDAMLRPHMAPKGCCGLLKVTKGRIDFFWEDSGERIAIKAGDDLIIHPERVHYLEIPDSAEFFVEFYEIPEPVRKCACSNDSRHSARPGEKFLTRSAAR